MDDLPPAARAGCARARGGLIRARAAAADRRRRRRDLREATAALRAFVDASGIPVCETQAGRGALVSEHPLSLGAVGATGTSAANRVARDADLVIGIGTRWSDFTTASKSAFQDPTSASSTSTWPRSTPASKPGCRSSATRARRSSSCARRAAGGAPTPRGRSGRAGGARVGGRAGASDLARRRPGRPATRRK